MVLGGWYNKLQMGLKKAVQRGSVAHAESGRKWVWVLGEGHRSVKGVQASNGRCGVWPRVADRFMKGIKEGRSLERLQDKESVLTS